MRFTVGGSYDIDVDGFWSSVFFEPAFNDHLYADGLNFDGYEITEERVEADTSRVRVLKAYPSINVPSMFQRILGRKIYYIEHGEYDPTAKTWRTRVEVPKLASKLQLSADMSFTPAGPGQCTRSVVFDVNVQLFGLGKMLERFIESTLRENYETARIVTNQWIHQNIKEC